MGPLGFHKTEGAAKRALRQYSYLMRLCRLDMGARSMRLRDEGTVSIEVDGQKHTGGWKAEKNTICVRFAMESETTHIGSEPYPYTTLTQQLMSELVQRYKARAK